MIESELSNIIFLQETMGSGDSIIIFLINNFKGWNFVGLYSFGSLGGLILGFQDTLTLTFSFVIHSRLILAVHSLELDMDFHILNIYGPYDDI
jgi:hypothetical protein